MIAPRSLAKLIFRGVFAVGQTCVIGGVGLWFFPFLREEGRGWWLLLACAWLHWWVAGLVFGQEQQKTEKSED